MPSSNERVWLCSEASRPKPDDEVEVGEVFRPASLSSSQEFSRRKVLEIFVVSNDVDWCG